jgi:hypothetical protein
MSRQRGSLARSRARISARSSGFFSRSRRPTLSATSSPSYERAAASASDAICSDGTSETVIGNTRRARA